MITFRNNFDHKLQLIAIIYVDLDVLYDIMVSKLGKLSIVNEFNSHWVPHILGLVPN